MAEYTNVAVQTVAARGNVIFSETPIRGCRYVVHREGSGVITLKSQSGCCKSRYRVSFGANVAIPAGGTTTPISVAISIAGEPLGSATAISTPAAAGDYNNIFVSVLIEVPCGCCANIGVVNMSGAEITVQNANIIVDKEDC